MIWAVEWLNYAGAWEASEGRLFTTRRRARDHLSWARKQFPDARFRIRAYVPKDDQ